MIKKLNNPDAAYKLFFSSLANHNRLKIVNILREGKKNVGEICKATGFEQTMVSHNLKRLGLCGMVFSEREGRYKYYNINKNTIKPLLEMIDAHMEKYCCKLINTKKYKHRDKKSKH